MLENLFVLLSASYLPFAIMITLVIIIWAPHRFKSHVFLYAVVFGMIAYCYNPTYEIDLSRYFQMLDNCRSLPLSQAFSWADDGLVVKNFLFWLISKTGDNHILPLLSMSTVFGISAYITADCVGEEYDKLWKILLFQLMFLPFYSTLSNVRNVTAFSLIILAVYLDVVKGRRNVFTVLLYILPCFMHMTGFVLVLIRLALILFKKHPYIGISLTLGIPTASIALYERVGGRIDLPGNIGRIISYAIWKAYASSVNTSDYARGFREGGYNNACRLVTFIMFAILLVYYFSQLRDENDDFREYKTFVAILTSITMIWVVLGTVKYWIFDFAVIVGCGPLLVKTFDDDIVDNRIQGLLLRPAMVLCLVTRLALELYFISTRIDLTDYINNFLTCSLWSALAKGLYNMISTI